MDFKRIQWIFLLIFVAIDIFLGLQWYQGIQFDMVETVGSTSVLKEMQADNISFKKPSTTVGEGYYIAGQDNDAFVNKVGNLHEMSYIFNPDTHILSVQFATRHRLKIDVNAPQRALDHFIRETQNVVNGTDYVYSEELTSLNPREVVYVQAMPSGKVYDASGEIRFKVDSDGYVTGYNQTYVNDSKILREKTPTISEEKALTWLYQYNQIPNNSDILWTKLAYAKLLSINKTTVYVPTWFFGIRNNANQDVQVKRINAFTGTIVKEIPKHLDASDAGPDKEVFK